MQGCPTHSTHYNLCEYFNYILYNQSLPQSPFQWLMIELNEFYSSYSNFLVAPFMDNNDNNGMLG